MSLYLSRICLNPLFAPNIKLVASPEKLHEKLYALLAPDSENDGRAILFRVDTTDDGPTLLVQTTSPPDLDALELAPRALRLPPAVKPFDPEFKKGQRLSFRLMARPSCRKAGNRETRPDGKYKTGPRRTCRDDDERLKWLERKGNSSGFVVETAGLTVFSLPAIKSDLDPRQKGGSFTAVRFDGVLVVTDPEKLKAAVANGIGPQKAYGFGLLSLAPMDR